MMIEWLAKMKLPHNSTWCSWEPAYVLSGQLRLILGDEEYILQPHDAAHFDARIPHCLNALSNQDTKIMLVSCEASHTLLRSYL